ncbi:TPA: hypothetical protein ACH3X1_006173 [Trebouxia sp. C0004]
MAGVKSARQGMDHLDMRDFRGMAAGSSQDFLTDYLQVTVDGAHADASLQANNRFVMVDFVDQMVDVSVIVSNNRV